MKKASFLMVIAAAAGFASCTAQGPKATLKSDVDSISYSYGLTQTDGFKEFLARQRGVDTTYIDQVVKGILDGANGENIAKQKAYAVGAEIGEMISQHWIPNMNREAFGDDTTKTITLANLVAGFIDGTLGKGEKISMEDARSLVEATRTAAQEREAEKRFGANREEGEKFLAENKTKEGVQVTASGLQYKIIKQGTGAKPTANQKVKVHYKGTLLDGTEFDSSYKRNEPTVFAADQVIKGWTEALTMMPVGSKWELYIPQELAYGSRNMGKIKPFSTLIFEVELIEIVEDKK